MFPKKPTDSSTTNRHSFDEARWVINVRKSLDAELEQHPLEEVTVCIFTVPKALMSTHRDSYTPQRVSIGPYHCLKPELHETERYKLMIARKSRNQSKSFKFHDLVENLQPMEVKIYIFRKVETLIDRVGHNEILRDVMMIENQIPLFVLRKTLEFQLELTESAGALLLSVLKWLCRVLSPLLIKFDDDDEIVKAQFHECNHIYDFLYQMIVPRIEEEEENKADENRGCKLLRKIKLQFKRVFASDTILRLPRRVISNLPGFIALNYLFTRQEKEAAASSSSVSVFDIEKPPLVSLLTPQSRSQIQTNTKRQRFNDINTETVLRNLVAYEASNTSGPLVFTRYTELINGIIDSDEDVRLLREQGVLVSRLKSDQEAAEMWNGMNKSVVRLTKVGFLDKTIEEVNRYYTGRWKVKIGKFVEVYVYGSSKIFAFLGAVLLFVLVSFQVLSLLFSLLRLIGLRTG
ncbi:unnamed protein product [Brassica oleracea]